MIKNDTPVTDDGAKIITDAVDVLKVEAQGLLEVAEKIDHDFVRMVDLIYQSGGRVIVGGIGKSGIVGRKIVATLNSTGTRALFMHPVEAMHGDLGMVCSDDIFLALSNSGETDELNILLPSIRAIGCRIVSFTGNRSSTLAAHSDIVVDVGVSREACPLGIAPTASSTALLAMGDALAVALINRRKFNLDDFQKVHPGGALGQRLASRIEDIMLTGEHVPVVREGTTMVEAVQEVDRVGLGVTFVLDGRETLSGIITDGDIRRCLVRKCDIDTLRVESVMTRHPLTLNPQAPAYDALNVMEQNQITVLPITGQDGRVVGILHLHDILGKGAFKFNGCSR